MTEFNGQNFPIGFAIVGYGRMGKRHASILSDHPNAFVHALVDVDETCRTQKEGAQFFGSLEAMLESPLAKGVSVISIAAPNGYHASLTCKALEASKHVVVEKPLALSTAETEQIKAAARKSGKLVFVVMQNRFATPACWLHALVRSGRLGKIFMVQVDAFWNRDGRYYRKGSWHGNLALDGGVLFTQFSHFIDTLLWIFGDIGNVHASCKNFAHVDSTEFDDSGFINFEFQKGGIGAINFSTAVFGQNLENRLTVIAENGTVRLKGQYLETVDYCNVRDFEGIIPDSKPVPPETNHGLFYQEVIDMLSGRIPAVSHVDEAARVVEVIERIYKG